MCLLVKDVLYGILWQLIRHSVIPHMVVLEELWTEMVNIFLEYMCVFTSWGGDVVSHFVKG